MNDDENTKYGGYINLDDVGGIASIDPVVMQGVREFAKHAAEKCDRFAVAVHMRLMEDRIVRWRMKRIKKKLFKEMWGGT